MAENLDSFGQFVETVAHLRAEDGCPWDRAQTHQSIAHNMIEEAYEAADALEANDVPHIREELGDVLLQVVLQSQIATDNGEFTIDDVCNDINAKMIRRHPHVFGEAKAANANEVLNLWDQVKLAEKAAKDNADALGQGGAGAAANNDAAARAQGNDAPVSGDETPAKVQPKGLLDGVPASFPALMQAQKISRKAVASGFEWDSLDDVWQQVNEERLELESAYAAAPKTADGRIIDSAEADASFDASDEEAKARVAAVQMEFGDLLFSLVNVARKMGIDAEASLRMSCAKFRERWAHMERAAWLGDYSLSEISRDQLEDLWVQAKQAQNGDTCANTKGN